MCMTDFAELAMKTIARDGELFIRERTSPKYPCGYALEAYDPDLVPETLNRRPTVSGGGEIRMGVEVDEDGRPTGYHVSRDNALYGTGAQDYAFLGAGGGHTVVIPASEMFQLARFRRVNQTRGVTWMGPTMIALRMLDGYEEAELVAARTAAAKMGFFEQKDSRDPGQFGPDDPTQPMTMDASPGTLEQLPAGYTFQSWDPQHPTAQFPAFVKNVLRKVAAGLGVSYNALASDLEGVNYSSMRSGLLIERDTWRRLQRWWVERFLQRVYRNWLRNAITSGELNVGLYDPRKLEAVRWMPRGWAWVDPLKDAEAGVVEVQTGLGSRQMMLAEQGLNFQDVLKDLAREEKEAKALGLDISGPRRPPLSAGTGNPGDTADAGTPGEEASGTPPARAAIVDALRNGRNGHARS
jgi:lambda family phage portal protein